MIVSFDDNVKATAFVDASGRTGMRQQLLHESASATIKEIVREHAPSLCTAIRVGSLELSINILQKQKMLVAAGADSSAARGACILETRSGMLPNALHGILGMSG